MDRKRTYPLLLRICCTVTCATRFVDITASESVASVYDRLLEKSIAVVACNKVAASSGYRHYLQAERPCREYNAPFLFETNVGAVYRSLEH